MASEIIMPKMGDAMTEGKVVRWYKKAGDAVKKGEPVLEIETDKVNLDLEAEADGTLTNVVAAEGQMVDVGGVLATIAAAGESTDAPAKKEEKPSAPGEATPAKEAAPGKAAAPPKESTPAADDSLQRRATDKKDSIKHSTGDYAEAIEQKGPRIDRTSRTDPEASTGGEGGRQRSSPLARKMARDLGLSLEGLQGSGPKGRIVASDVQRAQSAPGPAAAAPASSAPAKAKAPAMQPAPPLEQKVIPLTAMRRTIAKRLAESTGPIPHFYLTADLDVTNLLSVRQQLMEIEGSKVSLNDFVVRAVALALRHHPSVNASWGDEAITLHGEVHVGIAVSTPEGLITPVVRNADRKTVGDIAAEVRTLAEKAKNRKLTPSEYQGSTFTISNLGAWGIEEFTAIINPPNVAILAVGAAEARAVVVERQIVVRDRMKVTLSCDHRVVDGALGAEFLRTLRQYIEQPLRVVV
jgi:pyruvate dehydrogenase E2 component (dihydrolipoamide acetyltransferase)